MSKEISILIFCASVLGILSALFIIVFIDARRNASLEEYEQKRSARVYQFKQSTKTTDRKY